MKSDRKADLYVKNVTGASDEKTTERDINVRVNGRNQLVSSVELDSVQLAQDGFVAEEAWLSTSDVEKKRELTLLSPPTGESRGRFTTAKRKEGVCVCVCVYVNSTQPIATVPHHRHEEFFLSFLIQTVCLTDCLQFLLVPYPGAHTS